MTMRFILCLLLTTIASFSLTPKCRAATFYVSASGNDANDGRSEATAWQTLARASTGTAAMVAGDSLLFRRGDTFRGSLVIGASGGVGNPIVFGAYGTGENPILSGFAVLSGWVDRGGGVFEANTPSGMASLNLVTLDGAVQRVGRFPNADAPNGGYLTYESQLDADTLVDEELTDSPNWTGAEVVVRIFHFLTERGPITEHSGQNISFALVPTINPANGMQTPVVGNEGTGYGYFIQRDVRTLDSLGEWFHNPSNNTLRVFFGDGGVGSHVVNASSVDAVVDIGTASNVTITGLTIEGANLMGVRARDSSNVTIQNSNIRQSGAKGVFAFNVANIVVDHVILNDSLSSALDLTARHQDGATVTHCEIHDTAIFAGMGAFSDAIDSKAVYVSVDHNALIEHNIVENSGFTGIEFQGNDVVVRNNLVRRCAFVQADAGCIYTYINGTDAMPGATYTNRLIDHNIIFDAIGAPLGANGGVDVEGIYLDGRSMNVTVSNNTVVRSNVHGIYSNNPSNVRIENNTVYDSAFGWGITRYSWGSITSLVVQNNVFFARNDTQRAGFYYDTGLSTPTPRSIEAALMAIGTMDHNIYNTPGDPTFKYAYAPSEGAGFVWPSDVTLEEWRTMSGLELSSTRPPPNTEAQQRFEYNASEVSLFVDLAGQYLGTDGTVYDGSITLAPYTSAILIANGPVTGIDGGVRTDAGAQDGGGAEHDAASDASTLDSDSGVPTDSPGSLAGGCNCDVAPGLTETGGRTLWSVAVLMALAGVVRARRQRRDAQISTRLKA